MTRRLVLWAAAAAVALCVTPATASAHGLVGRSDLPVPDWLFTWGAAAVLVLSFVALAVLWPSARLQDEGFRPLPQGLSRTLGSRAVDILCSAIGVALLVFTVYAGLRGQQAISANWAPTFVYVAFWLGFVPVSVLFGDVFRAFNPWRAIGRATGWLFARVAPTPPEPLLYPARLGYWPAAVGLLAFGWLELVSTGGSDPDTVAIAALVYSAATFVGMALFGVEQWSTRGEAFGVYFGLFARMSPLVWRDGRLGRRKALAGLASWPPLPGSVGLLAVMIGVVSFDGLSAGEPYNDLIGGLNTWLRDDVGLSPQLALQTVYGASMLLAVAMAAGFFYAGIAGVRTIDPRKDAVRLARSFSHTLVPIALAYVAAHYVSLLLLQGQALGFLISDPLGRGEDFFGTAGWTIDYAFIGAETFWYLQVGFVVVGHVAALVLAHDRALVTFPTVKNAVRSQYWLLGVMVGYTTLALWLLAQAREG